jgi:adenylate kinase
MLKNGEPIPDGTSVKLLKDRLEAEDCKTNGWILKGAPTSIDQIALLKELYQQPSLILSLDMPDNLIYEKLEQRRFDPVTNTYHYVLDEAITDEVILKRLVHKYEDQHRYIKKKLLDHRTFMHHMILEYNSQLYRLNAEKPVEEL